MFAENVEHNLYYQWKGQSHSPAHVLMRLYQMDNSLIWKEGGHVRIFDKTFGPITLYV